MAGQSEAESTVIREVSPGREIATTWAGPILRARYRLYIISVADDSNSGIEYDTVLFYHLFYSYGRNNDKNGLTFMHYMKITPPLENLKSTPGFTWVIWSMSDDREPAFSKDVKTEDVMQPVYWHE